MLATNAGKDAPLTKKTNPFYQFTHEKKLRTRTMAVLKALDAAEDPRAHAEPLAQLIVELTDVGMGHFFMVPLRELRMGFVVEQSAQLALSSIKAILGPMVRNIVMRMDERQLRYISGYIRDLMD